MCAWHGKTYYTAPERVNFRGLEFVFDGVEDGEPVYVHRGKHFTLRTVDFKSFELSGFGVFSVVMDGDISMFPAFDEFFGGVEVFLSSGNCLRFEYGDSSYTLCVVDGMGELYAVAPDGLSRIRFDLFKLPEALKNPEKYSVEVVLPIPGELIDHVWSDGEPGVVLRNGVRVVVRRGEVVAPEFNLVVNDVENLARNEKFVVLGNLLKKKRVDIRSDYGGDPIGVVKRLVRLGEEMKIAGPLVRVYGDQVNTPRGFVFLRSPDPVVDEEVVRAVGYVLGMNDDFEGRVSVVLQENYSSFRLTGQAAGAHVYLLGGRTFWECGNDVYCNGKYRLVSGKGAGKNVIPLGAPVKSTVMKRLKAREDVLPGDVYPGLSGAEKVEDNLKGFYVWGERKSAWLGVKFFPDGVVYTGVPYLEGVATVKVPWDYGGNVFLASHAPEDVDVRYTSLVIVNGIEDYEEIIGVGEKTVEIMYEWGSIIVRGRRVKIRYRGAVRVFEYPVIIENEEDVNCLVNVL